MKLMWHSITAIFVCLFSMNLGAQTPQIIRGPYLQLGTPTSVIVRWRTDIPTDSILHYGSAVGSLNSSVIDPVLKTEHTIELSGLAPKSTTYYSIEATGHGVLVGDDSNHFYRSSPVSGERQDTRIWVLGDSGTADSSARHVRDAFVNYSQRKPADLVLMLGDNAYNDGKDSEYQVAMFQNMYESVLRNTVFWPAYGNHDAISADATMESGPYFDIFNLPKGAEAGGLASGTEAYYSFDHGNIHFVVLDSQTSDRSPTGAMATWLQNDLAQNTLEWTIAYWHHPPYSKGSHDSDMEARLVDMRQNFLPILENAGVDLVLGGHSHAYERSFLLSGHYGHSSTFTPAVHGVSMADGRVGLGGGYKKNPNLNGALDGCVYVVAGASGKISGGTFDHPTSFFSLPILGSCVIDVEGDQLDLRYLNDRGFLIDFFSITKNGVTPIKKTHLPVLQAHLWKYEDSGTDLGTAWRQPSFDCSAWGVGMAPLGYGETWVNTTVSHGGNPSNVNPTTYFRRDFHSDLDPIEVEQFMVAALYDDGYVMYLNGVEVARSSSMPPGAPSYGTLASGHEAVDFDLVDLYGFRSLLQPGLNTLAVEVHQTSASSSDLIWECALLIEGQRSFLQPEAAGNVLSASGEIESVFKINGSDGGPGRSVDVKVGEPFTFSMAPPSIVPQNFAPFTLFGFTGTPGPAEVFPLPNGLAPMLFPPAVPGVTAPLSFLVGDNFLGLTGALAYTTPAPWSDTNPGLGFPGIYTFHGWIATGPFSRGNDQRHPYEGDALREENA